MEAVHAHSVSLKQLESIAGIMAWITYVFVPGKPRRNVMYREIAKMKQDNTNKIAMSGPLRQQLLWWFTSLRELRLSFGIGNRRCH